MMKMVYKTLDQLEPVSREVLGRLAAMKDEEIDYSDIPLLLLKNGNRLSGEVFTVL